MPVVTIRMAKGRTLDQKRALVEGITEVVTRTLQVTPDWVTIFVEELDKENIAKSGILLSES